MARQEEFAGASSVKGQSLDGVFSAGHPRGINGTDNRAEQSYQAGAYHPSWRDEDRKRRKNPAMRRGPNGVTERNASDNSAEAEQRRLHQQSADNERRTCAERFEHADVSSAFDHGGVHGQENYQQADGHGEGDHGVNEYFQPRNIGRGHQGQQIFQGANGVARKIIRLAHVFYYIVRVLGTCSLDEEN